MKKILITGGAGFIGYFLSQKLLALGLKVVGIDNLNDYYDPALKQARLARLTPSPKYSFIKIDLAGRGGMERLFVEQQFDAVVNLAAQRHVAVSFEEPEYTANSDALGTLRLLEAIRILGLEKKNRFYQASTSELFGKVQETSQKETTPLISRCVRSRRIYLRNP